MKRIVVIGNGMVGYKFCEKFIAKEGHENYQLHVFGEERLVAYDRVHLSSFYEGKTAEELAMAPLEWYTKNGIQLYLDAKVVKIDRINKTIYTSKNGSLRYDYLVIATGSAPFVPKIAGSDKQGVFVYRTIDDLEAIASYAQKIKASGTTKGAILGGGLLGLEAAKALKDLDLEAHVVEFASRLMPRQLDEQASRMLEKKLKDFGLGIHLGKSTKEILGNGTMTGMDFGNGEELDVSMLVISAGIAPRDELAKEAGLDTHPKGGICVDATMKTSDPDIFAIGEVASYGGMVYGLVAPGYMMAEVAASQILGGNDTLPSSIDMSTQLKLVGVEVASFGDPFLDNEKIVPIIYENKNKGVYKRINVDAQNRRLLGGILIGDSSDYNALYQMYINNLKTPEDAEDLILGSRGSGGSNPIGSIDDLPDSAVICSCERVDKAALKDAVINKECKNYKEISSCTKAGTGCGGCKPMVTDILNHTLKGLGLAVKQSVCEHFDYTRQELYDLVKINKLKDFNQLLSRFGRGLGCEFCKPVGASIFASITAETANKQRTIQDSNDKYLANIQRNGTYSVIPRIPGGEITAEKLTVIGTVADKYNLYVKITGGQRIDLLGAHLDQLPAIWKELVDAGFESGHAYGKALRTVKSCVGSLWCRYGMLDSTSLAIRIEERYRGLRAPHKIKGGVSACIRECAEARGKDFGIIAVEGGWNLYVCGNGGANPKHAVLLAEALDEPTLIKYLDRFLMFYIKTAGHLIRTAPWLEKMEGGIDHLKDVVVNDSLGIGKDLENEMEQLVQNYECEWKQALQSPEILKKYRHFVNVEDKDDNITFVSLRDQIVPL